MSTRTWTLEDVQQLQATWVRLYKSDHARLWFDFKDALLAAKAVPRDALREGWSAYAPGRFTCDECLDVIQTVGGEMAFAGPDTPAYICGACARKAGAYDAAVPRETLERLAAEGKAASREFTERTKGMTGPSAYVEPVGQPGVPAGSVLEGRARLAVHGAFQSSAKGAPSCAEVPNPLHPATSHSWLCDEMTTLVAKVATEGLGQCSEMAFCDSQTGGHDVRCAMGGGQADPWAHLKPIVPVEPSRPGTGEAKCDHRKHARCVEEGGCAEYHAARRAIATPAPGKPSCGTCAKCGQESTFDTCVDCYEGKPTCDCTAATACAFHQPGKPDEAPLSERMDKEPRGEWLREEVNALESRIRALKRDRDRWKADCAQAQEWYRVAADNRDNATKQLATRTAEVESLRAERDATRDKLGEEKLRRIEYAEEFQRACEERDVARAENESLRAAATAQVARIAELMDLLRRAVTYAREDRMRTPGGYMPPPGFYERLARVLETAERLVGAPAPKATP